MKRLHYNAKIKLLLKNFILFGKIMIIFLFLSYKETGVYLWTAAFAFSVVPFVLWALYLATWDMSSVKSHCKGIISRHLYKEDI